MRYSVEVKSSYGCGVVESDCAGEFAAAMVGVFLHEYGASFKVRFEKIPASMLEGEMVQIWVRVEDEWDEADLVNLAIDIQNEIEQAVGLKLVRDRIGKNDVVCEMVGGRAEINFLFSPPGSRPRGVDVPELG